MIVSYDEMKDYLHRGPCKVNFRKANSEVRTMECTLRRDLLPAYDYNTEPTRDSDKSRVIVWDLEKESFRSFRLDSINWIMAPEAN